MRVSLLVWVILLAFAMPSAEHARPEITVYSAPGLRDGASNWFDREFAAFERETGTTVVYVQDGAGLIIDRAERERSNVDVLITTPPFMQQSVARGLIRPNTPVAAEQIDGGSEFYQPLAHNYFNLVYYAGLGQAPETYLDLLNPKFKGRLQYSSPDQAGDGISFLLQLFHIFGSKDAGFDYLRRLQINNVGGSQRTAPLVDRVNSGQLYIANGDLQMNIGEAFETPNAHVFWPADLSGQRSTIGMPYYIGLGAKSKHVKVAKLFINFLLSKEAQMAVGGAPVRKDVHRADVAYSKWEEMLQGVAIWQPDWDQVARELPADLARWHAVTGL